MLNFAGAPPLVTTREADSRQLIAADLRCLIAQVESSMRLIDAAMINASLEPDGSGDPAGSADIVVLDDVTPRYATASAALNACRAGLGHALQCLSESGNPA
ncbi:hypothetical protein PMI42_04339 [Bradyrhizobium sp. YR681]|uniref:hypothetical protein n=1 Tax=Bradyrhizobium sp. YR681 TaxID=1144344 RepID=UPI000271237A|nr:hypothetical protein [Bradyrhizobium sp. YR681]EJN12367.1 hypothetical protein PMI42_04339 [Bradyrhizobium sp. YR681]